MRNLLFNSLAILTVFLIASCSYNKKANKETSSEDSAAITVTDTNQLVKEDSLQPIAVKGDSVTAQSSSTVSNEQDSVSGHTGAVNNPGANQTQIDSIKKEKSKGKGKK